MHFVKYNKGINPDSVIKETLERIEWQDYTRRMYLLTLKILFPKWEGKKITRHAFNEFKSVLEVLGYVCSYDNSCGSQYYFVVKSDKIPYQNGTVRFFMGYSSDPYLKKESFEKSNVGYNNLDDTIGKLEAGILAIPKLATRWNAALKELQAVNKEAEQYKLEYTFDIQDK
jgi:hypothetical protein